MKVRSLRLQGYRGFDDATIELDPQLTVLVGRNGSGKTTVLDALSSALRFSEQMQLADREAFQNAFKLLSLTLEIEQSGEAYTFTYEHRPFASAPQKHEWIPPRSEDLVFVLYGAARTIHPRVVLSPSELPDGSRWIEDVVDLSAVVGWFKEKERAENMNPGSDGGPRRDPGLEAVRRAVSMVLPGLSNPKIEQSRMVLMFDKDTRRLRMSQLSDGEKSLMAMVFDLTRRLIERFPESAEPLDSEALVLIDEIELHLHPGWQRSVVPALRRTFPNCQFVITTHSPQVLSSVHASNVRVLEDFKVRPLSTATWHRDTNRILETALGDAGRPPDVALKLNELRDAVDRVDGNGGSALSEARKLIEELHSMVEGEDADVFFYEQLLPPEESTEEKR